MSEPMDIETPSEEDKKTSERIAVEVEAMRRINEALTPLSAAKRIRVIRAASILLGLGDPGQGFDL